MTVEPKPISCPWWTYVRFSLRGLIILVLLIGTGLGWLVRSLHIQRNAVAAIKNAGGGLSDDESSTTVMCKGESLGGPKWLVDLIGIDFFGHVTRVWLRVVTRIDDGLIKVIDAWFHGRCRTRWSSVASGFVINLLLTTEGPFRSPSKGERNGPPRMISRDVANHQAYAATRPVRSSDSKNVAQSLFLIASE